MKKYNGSVHVFYHHPKDTSAAFAYLVGKVITSAEEDVHGGEAILVVRYEDAETYLQRNEITVNVPTGTSPEVAQEMGMHLMKRFGDQHRVRVVVGDRTSGK